MGIEVGILKKRDLYEIKTLKAFEINDVFLYVFLLVVVSVLFILFVFSQNKNTPDGFTITVNGKSACTFTCLDNNLTINEEFKSLITFIETENGVTLTVFTDESKSGYNVIFIDTFNQTAKVTESTCSISKDCVYSPAISRDGAIFCAPHGLKITPNGASGTIPPITG